MTCVDWCCDVVTCVVDVVVLNIRMIFFIM